MNNFNEFNFPFGQGKNMGTFMARDAVLKMKIQTLKSIRDSILAQLKQLEAEREQLAKMFSNTGNSNHTDEFWYTADNSTNDYQYKKHSTNRYSKDMDPYIILEVDRNASYDEVTRAYRAAANKAHPDKGGSDMEMAKINAAYEALKMMNGWK